MGKKVKIWDADQYDWVKGIVLRLSPIMDEVHDLYMQGGWSAEDPRKEALSSLNEGLRLAFNMSYMLMNERFNPAYQAMREGKIQAIIRGPDLRDPDEGYELEQESKAIEHEAEGGVPV